MQEYVTSVCSCKTLEDVWQIHCKAMLEFGFDRLVYGFTQFMTPKSLGPSEDLIFLSSHTPEYMSRYQGDELYRHSPMIRWASKNTGACSWSWIQGNQSDVTEEEKKVIKINHEMKVKAGYTIAFPENSKRSKGVIALAAREGIEQAEVDEIWVEHGQRIEAMCNVAHLKIISLPLRSKRTKLSARQREVLEWVGDGKTNQDIATILGVTPATVEKHLRIAREKLGVETTAQAVLKMSFLNQIYSPTT